MITNLNFLQILSFAVFSLDNTGQRLNVKGSCDNALDFSQGDDTLHYKLAYVPSLLGRPCFVITENEKCGVAFVIDSDEAYRIVKEKDMDALRDLAQRLSGIADLENMSVLKEDGTLADNFSVEGKDAVYFWKIVAFSEEADGEYDVDEYDICDFVEAVEAARAVAGEKIHKGETVCLYRCLAVEPLTLDEQEIHWSSEM